MESVYVFRWKVQLARFLLSFLFSSLKKFGAPWQRRVINLQWLSFIRFLAGRSAWGVSVWQVSFQMPHLIQAVFLSVRVGVRVNTSVVDFAL